MEKSSRYSATSTRDRRDNSRRRRTREDHRPTLLHDVAVGAAAGLLATAPMTLVMTALHRQLPEHQQYPLPPRRITAHFGRELGLWNHLTLEQRKALTLLSHYGYGGAMGAIYGAAGRRGFRAAALSGMIFGLGVWGASYLGLLPAAGLHEPATEEPRERNALMIAAHLVWGAVTGEIARQGSASSGDNDDVNS